jgi:hypothetical protein
MDPDRRDDRPAHVEVYSWRWGPDEARRPGVPWIGVFLVIYGALLLGEQLVPEFRSLGNVALLAAGLASLVAWAIGRRTLALYAGAFLTALALPGAIEAAGVPLGPGWGTLAFGVAFLAVGAVRVSRGGGVGWQLWFGAILSLIGGSQAVRPDAAGYAFPVLLVLGGLILLIRGGRRAG